MLHSTWARNPLLGQLGWEAKRPNLYKLVEEVVKENYVYSWLRDSLNRAVAKDRLQVLWACCLL